ncbi:MAG: SDR family oxidoreductase [Chitinophagaceae bacterium]|nr:SDR family oxidoreductase [Chitinophagaceae bacterium]
MSFFKDKVIAITGGSEGIGKALIEALLPLGAKIATCGRNHDKLYQLQMHYSGSPLHTVACDVSKETDCKRFIESTIKTFGGIDILINNAGISMRALVKDVEVDVIRKVMDINFYGAVYCTKFALPSIIERHGSIVGISSIAGYRGLPGRSAYSASKFALQGWLEALRTELLEEDVNVMWVCPGFVTSNIRNAALDSTGATQKENPMDESKLMSAAECARLILEAVEKRKRSLIFTFGDKRTVLMNKLFPSLTDKLVRKFYFDKGELKK